MVKKALPEREAAAAFASSVFDLAREQWVHVMKMYDRAFESDWHRLTTNATAADEYSLAVLAVRTTALPNLLAAEQSKRMLAYTRAALGPSSPDRPGPRLYAFDCYVGAWNNALATADMPHMAVAAVLFDRLELTSTAVAKDRAYQSPLTVMALADAVVRYGGAEWKDVLNEFELQPD